MRVVQIERATPSCGHETAPCSDDEETVELIPFQRESENV